MRRLFWLVLFVFTPLVIIAQNSKVQSSLRARYGMAQYYSNCGGWFLLSYSDRGENRYGFADKDGNVVAENALKYKIHKGYIELYSLDAQQKADHDLWLTEKRQYDIDYQNYERVNAQFQSEMKAYDSKLQVARNEAERRWHIAQDAAGKRVQEEQDLKQQQNTSSTLFAGLVAGASVALAVTNARNAVKFEPFFEQVKAERNLTVPPTKPYNPVPSIRNEPSDGYKWTSYSLLQPCPYDFIDYANISEIGGYAEVQKDGRYGLVDAYLNEVIPCEYSSISKAGHNSYIVVKNGKYGLVAIDGKEIIPCVFDAIESSNGYLLCKRNKLWGIYTSSYEELYPCCFQQLSFMIANEKLVLKTQSKGLWGIIDFSNGKPLLENKYESINLIKSADLQLFEVVHSGRRGVYSTEGYVILPCEFDFVSIETLPSKIGVTVFRVKKNNTIGYYSMHGDPYLPANSYISAVYNDKYRGFIVKDTNEKKGVCDLYGRELIPCKYKDLVFWEPLSAFWAARDDRMGIVGLDGNEVVPFVLCKKMSFLRSRGVLIINNGDPEKGYGAIDFNGRELLPMKFKADKIPNRVDSMQKKDSSIDTAFEEKKEMTKRSFANAMTQIEQEMQRRSTFSYFAHNYVERVINDWQRRGEFEKRDAWHKRVNEETRKQKIYELTKEAQRVYIDVQTINWPVDNMSIVGQYDPDNETYRINSKYANRDLLVKVAAADAQEFKAQFAQIKKTPTFFIENDGVGVAEYSFEMSNGSRYAYSNSSSLVYSIAQVEYSFDPISIDQSASNMGYIGGKQTISTSMLTLGTSDVDVAIPQVSSSNPNTFAVIIANENYSNEKNVEFAYNDGQVFSDYCTKALGIPSKNVHFRPNATLNDMRFELNWIRQTAFSFNGDARFIVYYAGHGMPDDDTKDAYLLPVDGFSSDLSSGYRLSDVYDALGEIPAKNIVLLLDACFSGSQRSGETLASARGVAIKPKGIEAKGNLVVFSASTNKETAYPFKEKSHGLFTYYVLKKIKETNGPISMEDLVNYVSTAVSRQSIVDNRKSQTPTINASDNMKEIWKELSLR